MDGWALAEVPPLSEAVHDAMELHALDVLMKTDVEQGEDTMHFFGEAAGTPGLVYRAAKAEQASRSHLLSLTRPRTMSLPRGPHEPASLASSTGSRSSQRSPAGTAASTVAPAQAQRSYGLSAAAVADPLRCRHPRCGYRRHTNPRPGNDPEFCCGKCFNWLRDFGEGRRTCHGMFCEGIPAGQ